MDSRPQNNMPPPRPGEQHAPPPPPPSKPKLMEVNLQRRYAPHWLVQDDGTVLPNDGGAAANPHVLEPGIMMLHHEDAVIALGAQVALPTRATYRE